MQAAPPFDRYSDGLSGPQSERRFGKGGGRGPGVTDTELERKSDFAGDLSYPATKLAKASCAIWRIAANSGPVAARSP